MNPLSQSIISKARRFLKERNTGDSSWSIVHTLIRYGGQWKGMHHNILNERNSLKSKYEPRLKRKPILLIDMDGVAANYYLQFTIIWKSLYPDRIVLRPEELTSMYFEGCYPKKYRDDIRKITCGIGFFESLPAIEGAVETLNKIMDEDKFDVFLCSTPDADSLDHVCSSEKTRWAHLILGERWARKLILTHDKTLVSGDFLIDDKPNIKGLNLNPSWKQVVFTHAYNKDKEGFRLNSWADWPEVEKVLLTHHYEV